MHLRTIRSSLCHHDSVIDHTYMWDFLCDKDIHQTANEKHKDGINLVILNIPDQDVTNNIELICPSNHYSNKMFNAELPTVILLRREGFYEPILLV